MDYYYGGTDTNSLDLSESYSLTSTSSVAAYDRSSISSFGDRSSEKVNLSGGGRRYTSGRTSPGHDLGYHTLLTARPGGVTPIPNQTPTTSFRSYSSGGNLLIPPHLQPGCFTPNPWTRTSSPRASPFPRSMVTGLTMDPSSSPRSPPPPLTPRVIPGEHSFNSPNLVPTDTEKLLACTFKGKKVPKTSVFDKLPDDIILKIFSFLSSNQLCVCARVCRRWYFLAWEPQLWATVNLSSERIHVDRGLKTLFRLLCRDSPTVCLTVERIALNGCVRLSDKGLNTIARRCPELRSLEVRGCSQVTTSGIGEIVTRCLNLERLELTGCYHVTNISPRLPGGAASTSDSGPDPPEHPGSVPPPPQPPLQVISRRLHIQHLDLTDCHALDDSGIKSIVSNCPQLTHLFLRRCVQLTDIGIKAIASYCIMLRELSVSDCLQVTDFGMYELAKLGPNLRYLSVAKCDQISDAGLKQIAIKCYKLRYLNARGCEAVSDDSMEMLARSCPRLRALDIGKCDVTDQGLKLLSGHCPNLKKLSVKSCDMITDKGVQAIAYYCRGLQQLNIQDCHVTIDGYRMVKKFCKRCIIEHTNPGFF